jgi:hypothetical protein
MFDKTKLPKIYKRSFLNKESGMAAIQLEAEVEQYKEGGIRTLSAYLTISDCNRQICLDFWANNKKHYKKRLRKLRKIRKMLNDLEAFMLANPPKKADKKKEETVKEAEASVRTTLDSVMTELDSQ